MKTEEDTETKGKRTTTNFEPTKFPLVGNTFGGEFTKYGGGCRHQNYLANDKGFFRDEKNDDHFFKDLHFPGETLAEENQRGH